MLDRGTLVAKFGEWSAIYADAVVAVLAGSGSGATQLSLRRDSASDEATLTVRHTAGGNSVCYMDTDELERMRTNSSSFGKQCRGVVVTCNTREVSYTFRSDKPEGGLLHVPVGQTQLKSTELKSTELKSTVWRPDAQLLHMTQEVSDAHVVAVRRAIHGCLLLHPAAADSVVRIATIYLNSSTEVPPFQIYLEDDGRRIVFGPVTRICCGWCLHLIQAEVGVVRTQVIGQELVIHMQQPLCEAVSGPMRHRKRSFIERVRAWFRRSS